VVKFIPAKKIAGSRTFLKFTNVSPCHEEEEIRQAIRTLLAPYGKVGEMEPHFIMDPTGEFPDARLYTRRWDVELFIPEKTTLIMDSVPYLLDNQVVIYWPGQLAVCQGCMVIGHWASGCNSVLRAKAQAERLSKIPPAPIQGAEVPATEILPNVQPKTTTPKTVTPPANQEKHTQQPTSK